MTIEKQFTRHISMSLEVGENLMKHIKTKYGDHRRVFSLVVEIAIREYLKKHNGNAK